MSASSKNKILIIKLGALGDFLQAFGPFAALRKHHKKNYIVLLTTAPFKDLAEKSGFFDEILVITRPKRWHLPRLLSLMLLLRRYNFSWIYDLQTSSHTSSYYTYLSLLGWKGNFSGIAKRISHPHTDPLRDYRHTLDRQRSQLQECGISHVPSPDLSFLVQSTKKDPEKIKFLDSIASPFVLLVPGGAPSRPLKRWPLPNWQELIQKFHKDSISTIIIGGKDEKTLSSELSHSSSESPFYIDLIGKTSFSDLAYLATKALAAIGNDTGPMHLFAIQGCPSLTLFSSNSDPRLCGPWGRNVAYLSCASLSNLSAQEVWSTFKKLTLSD